MPRIVLDQAVAGMVLDQPVTNANGRILIPSGIELAEKHIKALKMWGIPDVSVKGGDSAALADPTAALDPAVLARAQAEVAERFKFADTTQPVMAEIFKQAVMHHARNQPKA